MKKNVNLIDRYVRWVLAVALLVLVSAGLLVGVWMWIALVLAFIFLITGWVQTCPIYMALGLSTLKKNHEGKV